MRLRLSTRHNRTVLMSTSMKTLGAALAGASAIMDTPKLMICVRSRVYVMTPHAGTLRHANVLALVEGAVEFGSFPGMRNRA